MKTTNYVYKKIVQSPRCPNWIKLEKGLDSPIVHPSYKGGQLDNPKLSLILINTNLRRLL